MMQTPIIVIDADVWIAALVYGGESRRVLTRALLEGHTIVASEAILSKVRRGLHTKFPKFIPDFEALLIALQWRLQIVELGSITVNIGTSIHHNSVLETAITGKAGVVVTGDKELLKYGSYQGVLIISPQVW